MSRMALAALAAVALGVAGCGGSSAPAVVASCNNTAQGLCFDVGGNLNATQINSIKSDACDPGGGTFSTTAPCPTAGRVGTCSLALVGATLSFRVYPASGLDATQGQQLCTQQGFDVGTGTPVKGTWTSG